MTQSNRIFNLNAPAKGGSATGGKPTTAVWQSGVVRCHYRMVKRTGSGLMGDCAR